MCVLIRVRAFSSKMRFGMIIHGFHINKLKFTTAAEYWRERAKESVTIVYTMYKPQMTGIVNCVSIGQNLHYLVDSHQMNVHLISDRIYLPILP